LYQRLWPGGNGGESFPSRLHSVAVPRTRLWCALVEGNTQRITRLDSLPIVVEEVVVAKLVRVNVQLRGQRWEALGVVGGGAPELAVVGRVARRDGRRSGRCLARGIARGLVGKISCSAL
jgi:hypothetical protein